MDHGVELRTPLVDAWLLRELAPWLRAFSRFPAKRLLAQAPTHMLPHDIAARPKTGFGTPVQRWLDVPTDGAAQAGTRAGRLARRVARDCYA
jgi:asparagine synthase (glutamine-hydrolysing)